MTTSTYEQPLPKDMAGSLGPGHTSTGEEVPFALMGDFPADSLTVSAPDFAAFMNAQLSRSPKLLREETWEQMWSPGLGEERLLCGQQKLLGHLPDSLGTCSWLGDD